MNNISISKKINKYNISDNPLLLSVSPNAVQPGLPATPEAFLESQKNIKNSNPILWLIKQKYKYNNQLSDLEHNLIQKTFSKDDNSNNNVCIKVNHPLPKISHINDLSNINHTNKKINKINHNNINLLKRISELKNEENNSIFKNTNPNNSSIPSSISNPSYKSKPSKSSNQSNPSYISNESNVSNNTLQLSSNDSQNKEIIYGNKILWKKGNLINSGEYSNIYQALNINNGCIFAVKEYIFIDPDVNGNYYIYLSFISGGSLLDFINNFRCINESLIKYYLKQILEALEYINSQGIIYGNLKLKHILFCCDGILKLVDFSKVKKEKNSKNINEIVKQINSDIEDFAKLVNELFNICQDKNLFDISSYFIEYKEFVSSSQTHIFKSLKNHPFIK